jgi:hypothetical protein
MTTIDDSLDIQERFNALSDDGRQSLCEIVEEA